MKLVSKLRMPLRQNPWLWQALYDETTNNLQGKELTSIR